MNLPDKKVSAILNLIGDHPAGQWPNAQRAEGGHEAPDKAVLNIPSRFTVEKLSMSGMLIQSSQELEIDQRFPMELFLHDDKPMRLTGRIASCSIKDEKGQEGYGVGSHLRIWSRKTRTGLMKFINLLY